MKRYKLKKQYPSLPNDWKENMIVYYQKYNSYCPEIPKDGSPYINYVLPKNEVEKNPLYWEEIKEYPQIIAYRSTSLFHGHPETYIKENDKYCGWMTDEDMLHKGNCVDSGAFEIYVVAKSEDEIFSIGEKTNLGMIKDFHFYSSGGLVSNLINTDGYGCGGYFNTSISFLKKVEMISKKKVLFVTDDGVDVFEGDFLWLVSKTMNVYQWGNGHIGYGITDKFKGDLTLFSTKAAATEWRDYIIPKYSQKDLDELPCKSDINEMRFYLLNKNKSI